MAKEILFVNGAIQNRNFTLDEKPHKAMGIIAARVLNHMMGSPDVVHAWNNVGTFADEQKGTADDRLDEKYNSIFMQSHLERWEGYANSPVISTDDNPDFALWAQDLLESALARGDVYAQEEDFIHCRVCGVTIAEVSASISACPRCNTGEPLVIKREAGLFVDLDEDKTGILRYEHIFNKSNMKQEISSLRQLPDRLLLSRDRTAGVTLDEVGFPGKILDPRLGIGLLSIYEASRHGYKRSGMVQTYSTMIRTVPYLNSVIKDSNALAVPEHRFAFYGMIDPELLVSGNVSPELLSLHALRQKVDIQKHMTGPIQKERASLIHRMSVLEKLAEYAEIDLTEECLPLKVVDPNVALGQLTNIVTTLNKRLGRAIEETKHQQSLDNQRRATLAAAYQHADTLRPVIN